MTESSDACVVGVDEAGKGPVLGPMVAAAVRADPDALPPVADSKRLSRERRETLAARLRERVAWSVAVVPTAAIDDPATDMNGLTVAAQAAAVRAVAADDRVRADAGDTDEARFARRLREAVRAPADSPVTDGRIAVESGGRVERDHGEGGGSNAASGVTVAAEHGADATHAVVAAASIVAKVTRDDRMDRVDDRYDRPVGSGYPSDETTRTFLREYVRERDSLPDCARASWGTAEDVVRANEQAALDGF